MSTMSFVIPLVIAAFALIQFLSKRSFIFLILALIFLGLAVFETLHWIKVWDDSFPTTALLKEALYILVLAGMMVVQYKQLNYAQKRAENLNLVSEEVEEEMEERKWTETQLRESRIYAESIVETIREPLLVLDSELRILKANRSFYQTFLSKPENTVGRPFYRQGEGYWNNPELIKRLKQIIPKGNSFEDFEITRKFGTSGTKTILMTARPIYQKEASSNLILLSMEDITARKLAQEEGRRLVRGIESAAEAIVMTDVEGIIRYVNPAFSKLTGYTSDEVSGQKISIIDSDYHSEKFYQDMWETILQGEVWSGEVTNRHKNGALHEVNLIISPVFDDNNELEGFVAVQNDITEIKRAKQELARRAEELARSNAELEQFAYIASHDLQEPLRMVSSYCQLLKKRYMGSFDKDADEFINFAVDGAKRMQQLINDLLAYSRVGRRALPFTPVDLKVPLQHALNHLQLVIKENDAEVKYGRMPSVIGDETQLIQLFQNLIGNAIKFRSDIRPKISISTSRKNGSWVLSVKDNGIGIDSEFADRIFVIFQRLHNHSEYPGTGMGLAICKKIIERHSGKIWVKSKPGKGSTFYFTLPKN